MLVKGDVDQLLRPFLHHLSQGRPMIQRRRRRRNMWLLRIRLISFGLNSPYRNLAKLQKSYQMQHLSREACLRRPLLFPRLDRRINLYPKTLKGRSKNAGLRLKSLLGSVGELTCGIATQALTLTGT